MKIFSLFGMSAAFAAVLASSPAQAYPLWFDFQGSLVVLDPSGGFVGSDPSVSGSVAWNYGTGTGTASFFSPTPFLGSVWSSHDITLTATQVGVAHADMLFDWGGNQNIHVTADFGMTPHAGSFGGGYDLITLDGDHDGVAGNALDNGPFIGMNVIFSGKVSGICPFPEVEFCAAPGTPPQIAPVPLLPAMWLLMSGLAGLAGIGRLGGK